MLQRAAALTLHRRLRPMATARMLPRRFSSARLLAEQGRHVEAVAALRRSPSAAEAEAVLQHLVATQPGSAHVGAVVEALGAEAASPALLQTALLHCALQGDAGQALAIVARMPPGTATLTTHGLVIRALCAANRVAEAEAWLNEKVVQQQQQQQQQQEESLPATAAMHSHLIAAYARRGDAAKVKAHYQHVQQSKAALEPAAWLAMIGLYCRQDAAAFEAALKLYRKHKAAQPKDVVDEALAALVSTACDRMRLQEAEALAADLWRADGSPAAFLRVLQPLLRRYASQGQVQKLEELQTRWQQAFGTPDTAAAAAPPPAPLPHEFSSALLQAHLLQGQFAAALDVFTALLNHSIQPSHDDYQHFITALLQAGKVGEIDSWLTHMQGLGLQPSAELLTTLVAAFAGRLQMAEAAQWFSRFAQAGIARPPLAAFTALVQGFAESRRLTEAWAWFEAMAQAGFQPTEKVVSALVSALTSLGHVREAVDLMSEMQHQGVQPEHVVWDSFLAAQLRYGRVEQAQHTVHGMAQLGYQPSEATFNALIHAVAQETHTLSDVLDLVKKLFTLGYHPNELGYRGLLDAFAKVKRYPQVTKWFERMLEQGLQPDMQLCHKAAYAYAMTGRAATALTLITPRKQRSSSKAHVVSTSVEAVVLEGLVREGLVDAAAKMLAARKSHRAPLPLRVVEDVCKVVLERKDAAEVMDKLWGLLCGEPGGKRAVSGDLWSLMKTRLGAERLQRLGVTVAARAEGVSAAAAEATAAQSDLKTQRDEGRKRNATEPDDGVGAGGMSEEDWDVASRLKAVVVG